jgi:hypothetical protein
MLPNYCQKVLIKNVLDVMRMRQGFLSLRLAGHLEPSMAMARRVTEPNYCTCCKYYILLKGRADQQLRGCDGRLQDLTRGPKSLDIRCVCPFCVRYMIIYQRSEFQSKLEHIGTRNYG